MLKEKELIDWCWENLEFYNSPETWEDTYIVDILNGYRCLCKTKEGKTISFSQIRTMFEEED